MFTKIFGTIKFNFGNFGIVSRGAEGKFQEILKFKSLWDNMVYTASESVSFHVLYIVLFSTVGK